MNPIIISRLIESGYQVFLPVDGGSELLIRGLDQKVLTCRAQTASANSEFNSVFKIIKGFDMLAGYDPVTKNVWVIPSEILDGLTAIRLGKKYEDYLVPEPTSIEYKDRREKRQAYLDSLKQKASEIGKD